MYIKVKDGTEIFYKDWGTGQPIFFHHGWPLSSDDWDTQMMFFLNQGFRVIAHDRRGHGRSSPTANGHDMDTYSADVAELTNYLDLKDAIPNFPHGMPTTEAATINADLLNFIKSKSGSTSSSELLQAHG